MQIKNNNHTYHFFYNALALCLLVSNDSKAEQSIQTNAQDKQSSEQVQKADLLNLEPNNLNHRKDHLQTIEPEDENKKCTQQPPTNIWVDRVRSRSHSQLCHTAMWVDGLFGDDHDFNDNDFRGKVSVGFRQDEDDGFDPRLRVRIRTELPNVSSRLNAFIGRVEEDSYISNTEVDQDRAADVGLRSSDRDEDEWLVGLGYRKPSKNNNGFDYSVGAKLSSGLSPYAKIAHRHLFNPTEKHLFRTTQTVFWRRDERFGVSSSLDYTYLLNDRNIVEWDTSIKYTEEEEQWEWITSSTWHRSITKKAGLSSRIYVRGEEENPVSIPEYGVTFTYIQPFLRPWLFVETGIDFRWEKEFEDSSFKSATRFALQFQMLLGDYYRRGPNRKK